MRIWRERQVELVDGLEEVARRRAASRNLDEAAEVARRAARRSATAAGVRELLADSCLHARKYCSGDSGSSRRKGRDVRPSRSVRRRPTLVSPYGSRNSTPPGARPDARRPPRRRRPRRRRRVRRPARPRARGGGRGRGHARSSTPSRSARACSTASRPAPTPSSCASEFEKVSTRGRDRVQPSARARWPSSSARKVDEAFGPESRACDQGARAALLRRQLGGGAEPREARSWPRSCQRRARTCSGSSPRPTGRTRWPTSRRHDRAQLEHGPSKRQARHAARAVRQARRDAARAAGAARRAREARGGRGRARARHGEGARRSRSWWPRRSTRSPWPQGDDCDAVGDLRGASGKTRRRRRRASTACQRPGARADRVRGQGQAAVEAARRSSELDRALEQRDADFAVLVVPTEDKVPAKMRHAARVQRRQADRRVGPGGRGRARARGGLLAGAGARADGARRSPRASTAPRCATRSSARCRRWRTVRAR